MRKETTQKQMAFYKLYQCFLEDAERYVPTWEFLGEMFIKEIRKWVLMSYKCPTRLTDLFQENPNLMERKEIKGKSGSTYFGYRFRSGVQPRDIADSNLREFYQKIKFYEKPSIPLKEMKKSKCCGADKLEGSGQCMNCGAPPELQ